jgi:DNA primase
MDQAADVREKVDIVSLISEYLPLKKAGRNFNANCPFHNENTPSFVVSPERQIWHCFGCGKGGDAFTFLMEYEKIEFFEALQTLAKKAGVTLKNTSSNLSTSRKQTIYKLNKLTSEYYHYVLTKHRVGEQALIYLKNERGLSDKLINTYQIGFSPGMGDALSRYLIDKKKYKTNDLIDAGLSIQKGPRTIDFFRGRIMFPLIDQRDNIVGFSGRSLDDSGPKYINTKDTIVYHKGSMFFGFNQAKESIKKEEISIVVEGEFDVISLFSEGISNAVALKGTALTENQAILLSRFAPKVAMCLDKDNAGYMALKRSLPILEKRGLSISVIDYQEKDPDESIKKSKLDFKKAVKDQVEVYDFLIDKMLSENDINTGAGKKKITDEMLPLIAEINNEIIKEHYLKKLSKKIETSYESLLRQLDKKDKDPEDQLIIKKQKGSRREILEEYLLGLVLQNVNPVDMITKTSDILNNYKFELPAIGKIYEEIYSVKDAKMFDIKSVSKNLPKELISVFDKSFLMPLPKFETALDNENEIIRIAKEIKLMFLKDELKKISRNIKEEDGYNKIERIREEISFLASSN